MFRSSPRPARFRSRWLPLAALLATAPAGGQVIVDEIHYNPDGPPEFLELVNAGVAPVDVDGWCFTAGITFGFTAKSLLPGEVFVLTNDQAGFHAAYGLWPHGVYGGSLSNGGETLALAQDCASTPVVVDSFTYDDLAPWPTQADGEGPSLERIDCSAAAGTPRNWRASAGLDGHSAFVQNCVAGAGLPPFVTATAHGAVSAGVPIVVSANVVDAATVTLHYVLDFGTESAVPMLDDGASGDGAAGDGVYGGAIPGQPANSLVRYRIEATGATGTGHDPRLDDTILYRGTMVEDATSSALPILHWWIHPDDYADLLANKFTNETQPGALFYDGRLWDNIRVRVRGDSSRYFPKLSWKVDFPQGNDWQAAGLGEAPDDDFNLKSSYADKSYVRELLGWELFEQAGVRGVDGFAVRLHRNGAFYGLYHFIEQPDGDWMSRVGLDEDGALYEANGSLDDLPVEELPDHYEKETREEEDYSDLAALLAGLHGLTGEERRDFLFDAIDLPAQVNYLAVIALLHDNDHLAKNYFLYRDTPGTGRWTMLPWDLDLVLGRNWVGSEPDAILNDLIYADDDVVAGADPLASPSHPLFGDCEHRKWDGRCNHLIDALFDEPEIREMYFRRLRTLMDERLVEPLLEDRIDLLLADLAPEAALDALEWGQYGDPQTVAEAAAILQDDYLPRRRAHLFATHRVAGEIPAAQAPPAPGDVAIHEIHYAPAGGGAHEYVELHNRTDDALDLAGWSLDGIDGELPPGTVLLPRGYLVLAQDDPELRAEHGGGSFVPLDYSGSLADAGEALVLRDAADLEIDRVEYLASAPWPAEPAGAGPSLAKRCPNYPGADPASWQPGSPDGGTPGCANNDRLAADGFETGDLTLWSAVEP